MNNAHVNQAFNGVLSAIAPAAPNGAMDAKEYNAHTGISKSAICAARVDNDTLSMAAMRVAMIADREDDSETTTAMRWGTLAHAVLLEPVTLAGRVAVWGAAKRGGEWAEYKAANADRLIVTPAELDKLKAMREAIQADKDARWILGRCSRFEHPITWQDIDYGLAKARLDGCGEDCVLEYKTCRNIGKRAFFSAGHAMGYHIGAAWYWHGYGRPQSVYILAQQSTAPYSVACYIVPDSVLEGAYKTAREIAIRYRMAEKAGVYPGPYSGLMAYELPAWASGNEEVDTSTGEMDGGEL